MYSGVYKCLQAHLDILSLNYIQATSLRLMRDGWWRPRRRMSANKVGIIAGISARET